MADIDAPLAWRMQQDGYLMQINQLRDENTKLRELADKLSILASCECEGCLHVNNCPLKAYGDECPVSLEVKQLKRELGIEVGE